MKTTRDRHHENAVAGRVALPPLAPVSAFVSSKPSPCPYVDVPQPDTLFPRYQTPLLYSEPFEGVLTGPNASYDARVFVEMAEKKASHRLIILTIKVLGITATLVAVTSLLAWTFSHLR